MPRRKGTSATVVDQATNKKQKVASSSKRHTSGQALQLKPEHAVAYDGKKMYIQEVMTPAPQVNALNQTSQFSFIVENDAAGLIKDAVMRFQITVSGAGVGGQKLMPVPLWFDRIEWYDRHTGREIARYHGDAMYWILQTFNTDALELLEEPVNFCAASGKETLVGQPNGTRYYYLPLPHVWLDGFDLDLSLLRGDLEIKFYPKGDIRVEATGDQPTLNEIRWIGGSEMFSQISRLQFRRSKALSTQQHNYIDFQQYTDAGRALVANQAFTIDLDQFHHESAFLWFCLRPSVDGGADSNVSALNFQSLGPGATIDHENVHGRSMLGDGTPIDEEYFRKFINTMCWPHKNWVVNNAVYCVPFSNDIAGVFRGEVDGWHEFRGDRERLRIDPGSAPTDSTFTLTSYTDPGAVAPSTGAFVTAYYNGAPTAPLPLTTTRDELVAAVNQIPTVIADGIEFKASSNGGDALTVGIDINVAVYERGSAQPYTSSAKQFTMSLVGEAGHTGYLNSATTIGIKGFVSGTYQIDIYSVYYRHIQEHNGRLECEDL